MATLDLTSLEKIASILIAAIGFPGAILAALQAVNEMKHGRQESARQTIEKQKENRLKQAVAARDALAQVFSSQKSRSALQMLDWSGRIYSDGKNDFRISFDDLRPALRIDSLSFGDKELFIRECFDDLFGNLELLQHYIDIGLVHCVDVVIPLSYYSARIASCPAVFDPFLREYGYSRAKRLIHLASEV